MTRQLTRQSITLDELETLRGNNPHLLSGADQLMELVQQKLNDDLITLKDAEQMFGKNTNTLSSYITRGKIQVKKYMNHPSGRGRPLVLISYSELASYLSTKPKRGRPISV